MDLAIAIVLVVAAAVAFDVARTAPRRLPPPRVDGEVTTTQRVIRVDLDRRS